MLQVDYYLLKMETLSQFTENVAWKVTNVNVTTSHDKYPSLNPDYVRVYSAVKVTMNLQRKSRYYWLYILIPCLLLNTLGIGIFVFPAGSSEKVSFGWGILLTLFVFTIVIHGNIPKTSDYTPILGKYC